jgi:hypothetical protein
MRVNRLGRATVAAMESIPIAEYDKEDEEGGLGKLCGAAMSGPCVS